MRQNVLSLMGFKLRIHEHLELYNKRTYVPLLQKCFVKILTQ